jgi:hypothetical protein
MGNNVSAEKAAAAVITQFPAILVAFPFIAFENAHNAELLEAVEISIVPVLQTALLTYFWFKVLTRARRPRGTVD